MIQPTKSTEKRAEVQPCVHGVARGRNVALLLGCIHNIRLHMYGVNVKADKHMETLEFN